MVTLAILLDDINLSKLIQIILAFNSFYCFIVDMLTPCVITNACEC